MVTIENFCCPMRRHFIIGIIRTRIAGPAPVEMADFVCNWDPIVVKIKYCPFCGEELSESQEFSYDPE